MEASVDKIKTPVSSGSVTASGGGQGGVEKGPLIEGGQFCLDRKAIVLHGFFKKLFLMVAAPLLLIKKRGLAWTRRATSGGGEGPRQISRFGREGLEGTFTGSRQRLRGSLRNKTQRRLLTLQTPHGHIINRIIQGLLKDYLIASNVYLIMHDY